MTTPRSDSVIDFGAFSADHDVADLGGMKSVGSFADLDADRLEVSGNDIVIKAGSDRITLDKTGSRPWTSDFASCSDRLAVAAYAVDSACPFRPTS